MKGIKKVSEIEKRGNRNASLRTSTRSEKSNRGEKIMNKEMDGWTKNVMLM